MADSGVELPGMIEYAAIDIIGEFPELRNNICKILQDFGITTLHGKGFHNLTESLIELIYNALVQQKKKSEAGLERFLVGAYTASDDTARLTLNHFNCDGDLTDNYIDVGLEIAIEKARQHLKECDAPSE